MGYFFSALFGSLLGGSAASITGKTIKTVAFVAIVVALTVALVAALDGLALSVAVSLPNNISALMAMLMPHNTSECISVVVTARIARWVYDWHITFAKNLAE